MPEKSIGTMRAWREAESPEHKPTCDGIKRVKRGVRSRHQVRRGHDNSAPHMPRKASVLHEDGRGQSLRTQ